MIIGNMLIVMWVIKKANNSLDNWHFFDTKFLYNFMT